jgi:hypothetical protein
MKTIFKIFLSGLVSIVICLILFFINFSILTPVILGDLDKYDTEPIETSIIFDFFYEISSNTGYKPEPSYMNFILTGLVGILIGLVLSKFTIWKKKAHTPNKTYT